jgi:hypothetical protein
LQWKLFLTFQQKKMKAICYDSAIENKEMYWQKINYLK